jgi:hypothetical protein
MSWFQKLSPIHRVEAGMDQRFHQLLKLADRVLMHLEHRMAPEYETTRDLRALIDVLKNEGQNAKANAAKNRNEKAGRNS